MNILGMIVGILLLIGLIAFNILILVIGDIDKFVKDLESKYEDK